MRPGTRQTLIDAARRLSSRLPERLDRTVREVGKVALNYRGDRSRVPRYVQYAVVRRTAPLMVAPLGPGQVVVDSGDEEVGRQVFLRGGYDRWHMEAALGFLASEGVSTAGRRFLDVGANIGTSTIDALLQFGFGTATCFEPDPANFRLLRANLVLNGLDERAEVHALAVSDYDGTGTLVQSPTNSGDHRFAAAEGDFPCRRLDSFVEEGRLDPDEVGLVWIDVQGHEASVLRGAKRVLEAGAPVVVEYCPWLLGDTRDEFHQLIAERSAIVDVRALSAGDAGSARLTPADLPRLADRYRRHGYTDLLLLG